MDSSLKHGDDNVNDFDSTKYRSRNNRSYYS